MLLSSGKACRPGDIPIGRNGTQQLEFEITESVLINSFEQVKGVMQQLRDKGDGRG